MKRLSVVVAVVLVLSVLLTACGGGAAADPAGVVQGLMQAMQNKQMDQLPNFVCAAQRDSVVAQFNPASSLGSGIDSAKALDAMTIVMKDMTYAKTSETATAAVVHVKGTMSINFDTAKMTALMKAAGQDDATIQQSMGMVSTLFAAGIPIDNDMNLVKENGKWLVCQ
jgi:major membrane immunogen (membrane-anchored lipoprotein)